MRMSKKQRVIVALAAACVGGWIAVVWAPFSPDPRAQAPTPPTPPERNREFVGSASCRECHERFYTLWAPSHHGLAMQPFTGELARTKLPPVGQALKVEGLTYTAEFEGDAGHVRQQGPDGETRYPIAHVMGGKNVYYFLTPMAKGRLQVLPIAYDLRTKKWYDTTASGVRHFDDRPADQAVPWRDPAFTFNTSCYGCHVSQMSANYDLATDTYDTVWGEPGINCEACHGPGSEHLRVCRAAPKDDPPKDLELIVTSTFTPAQHNDTCAPCHAKMNPLSTSFTPGDRYFDHYDLVTLENVDFYPDGRDLGENYTMTGWRMSPCAKGGKLHCVSCHTSSGRYRFAEPAKADHACLPCHKQRVANPQPHTHHKPNTPGGRCVDCHMSKSGFARMMRTDHSMLPPTPAATAVFKSPNACNMCHTKKEETVAWADALVRKWRPRDYQKPVLHRAGLIAAARKLDWSRLAEMLAYLADPGRDEVVATALIRLLTPCPDRQKWPALTNALADPSPLVRSAAAIGLADFIAVMDVRKALLKATEDDYRLVRIRAAGALAAYPRDRLTLEDRKRLKRATDELEASLTCRPDDWASHYNMGIHRSSRGDLTGALASFETASSLRPDAVGPLVNASMAHVHLGQTAQAEAALLKALKIAPGNALANFNFALLLAGKGDKDEMPRIEKHLRAALKTDPNMAEAAYNLSIVLSEDRLAEAVTWARKAATLRPTSAKHVHMLALLLDRSGDSDAAARYLAPLVDAGTAHPGVYGLLGTIYSKTGQIENARAVYAMAISNDLLSVQDRAGFQASLRALGRS